MANEWMPGVRVLSGKDGGSMVGGPRKVVWHTTENDPAKTRAVDVASYLQRTGNTVHLVWHPLTGEMVQMIPANLAGRGLENLAGGVQTNRGGTYVIQIEVVGRASQPFTDGPCVGLDAIQSWLTSLGVPAVWSGTPDRSRVNWAKGGHFGHSDVPENAHWDPGKVDKTKLANTTKPPEVDMPLTEQEINTIAVKAAEQVWQRFTINGLSLQQALGRMLAQADPKVFAAAVVKALPVSSGVAPNSAAIEAAVRAVFADAATK